MPRRRRIKRFLLTVLKTVTVVFIIGIIFYPVRLLLNWAASLDFIILEKIARWIKHGIAFCESFLSKKIKIKLWVVLFLLLFIVSLISPDVFEFYREILKIVIDSIGAVIAEMNHFIKNNPVIAWLMISFVIIMLAFKIIIRTIGFVWTVILEAALILSLLFFSLYGISQALHEYCKIDFCFGISSFFKNILNYDPRIIFPFIFTVFIPLYSYILRRKRNFIIVRNENFFGMKDKKIVFSFSITNNSKRTRIIKKVFLLVNNSVTFLIKDYEKTWLTISPKEKISLEMEAKTFRKKDKFYSIKGKENLSSAYLCLEMLDGYWGRKLKLTSPINKVMLSSYDFKDEFLIPATNVKFPQPLIWNEKKSR